MKKRKCKKQLALLADPKAMSRNSGIKCKTGLLSERRITFSKWVLKTLMELAYHLITDNSDEIKIRDNIIVITNPYVNLTVVTDN
jgi:hypothetical protein